MKIRYRKLGYVALQVTDINKSTAFYENVVGMDVVERGDATRPSYLRCSYDHHNLILIQAKEAGLKRVAFELEDEKQFEIAYEKLQQLGLNPWIVPDEETEALCQGRTLRFKDPYIGLTFEFFTDIMQMGRAFQPKDSKIEQFGHVVLESPHFDELFDLFVNKLNFAVSDISGAKTGWAWLRAWPNPWHHTFAIVRGEENKMNHMAFNVKELDDVGKGWNRFKKANVPVLFGPGRHAPSRSIFLYFADPDGMTVEYSFGMEHFPEEGARKPRRLEPSLDTLDQWGSEPTSNFARYGKLITD